MAEFTAGNVQREHEIISLFSDTTEQSLSALENSVRNNNVEEWKSHTHKLYGSSATFGALAFAHVCDQAQDFHSADSAEKKEILKEIKLQYKKLDDYLQGRKNAT